MITNLAHSKASASKREWYTRQLWNRNPQKKQDTYIGITENEFKTRYNQHTSSCRLNHKKTATTLSEFIWKLKETKTEFH